MELSLLMKDGIVKTLKQDFCFSCVVESHVNGTHFAASDIAIAEYGGKCQVYRFIIIPHHQQRRYE